MKRRKALKSLGLGLSAGFILPELMSSCKQPDVGPEIKYSGTVAVIGAGAAGLYAADILRAKGIKVVVLEASSDLGGRVKSLKNDSNNPSTSIADFPVELGAEITYGLNSILGKIIMDLKVPYVDLGSNPNFYILDNLSKEQSVWEATADPDVKSVQDFISGLPVSAASGISVQAASGVSVRGQALLNSLGGNRYGSNAAMIGVQGLAQELKLITHDNKWIALRSNRMQDILISRFALVVPKVLLKHQVQQISYDGTVVTIGGMDNTKNTPVPFSIRAEKAIVTVPLSILKSGDISFAPALPSTITSSFANLGMDASIRISLDFKKNFWGYPVNNRGTFSAKLNAFPDKDGSGSSGAILKGDLWSISESGTLGAASGTSGIRVTNAYTIAAMVDNPGNTLANWLVRPAGIGALPSAFTFGGVTAPQYFSAGAGRSDYENTLSITVNGPQAATLSGKSELEITNQILAELDAVFNGLASICIRRNLDTDEPYYTIQDWTTEPYIKGGYSYPLINGSHADRVNIGTQVSNLFFAGEATDISGDAGTINGALASAERVAAEVVKSILGH